MVYRISGNFPSEEKYGLTNQIRRAAVSVPSNIAEGSARQSLKDQARFSIMAYGSLMEVLSQLIIATDLKYINNAVLDETRPIIEEISNKLNKLTQSQQKRHDEKNC